MFVNRITKVEVPDEANCKFCDYKRNYIQDPNWCFGFDSDIYNNKPCEECLEARKEANDTRIKN